jgi:hypothetical protein
VDLAEKAGVLLDKLLRWPDPATLVVIANIEGSAATVEEPASEMAVEFETGATVG